MVITIYKTDDYKVTDNFNISEHFGKNQPDLLSHPIDTRLFLVAEVFRKYWNAPTKITSSYRSPEHNKKEGGSSSSGHPMGIAEDYQLVSIINRIAKTKALANDLRKKGEVYQELKDIGVTGIIVYYNRIHIDFKNRIYENFNYSKKKVKKRRGKHGKY